MNSNISIPGLIELLNHVPARASFLARFAIAPSGKLIDVIQPPIASVQMSLKGGIRFNYGAYLDLLCKSRGRIMYLGIRRRMSAAFLRTAMCFECTKLLMRLINVINFNL